MMRKANIMETIMAKTIMMVFGATTIIITHEVIVGKEKMTRQVIHILIKIDGVPEIF